ncbi:MAG: UDP-glucose--hexose-1-phosphate uridylyltransferase [Terriglobales bacterium]
MPTSPMKRTAELADLPHQRLNPLTGRWVLVSPQRTQRPWLGKVEERPIEATLAYDPSCYLCPGNARAGNMCNPPYSTTFVFDNDYPALLQDTPQCEIDESGLIVARSEQGLCRVICFSPRHDLTIPRLSLAELRQVVDVWVEQYQTLGSMPFVNHVLVFENRGMIMGTSNPHPHCQVWANATVPNETQTEQNSLLRYSAHIGSCLLCDYLRLELQLEERIVCENEGFVVVVPYWAVWPFETLLLSRRHLGAMDQLTSQERDLLGDLLKRLTTRYDNLFETGFPYSMGFHQMPTDGQSHPEWHFHAHYYPPLLRSATVQKFMVGYEMLATPQRDITAESSAGRLRGLSEVHYL